MRPTKYPTPTPAAFITTLFDATPDVTAAKLYAVGDDLYEVPIQTRETDGRKVAIHDVDAARKIEKLSYVSVNTLNRDRRQIEYSSAPLSQAEKDTVLNVTVRSEFKTLTDECHVTWQGRHHHIPAWSRGEDGVAHSGDMREPEYAWFTVGGSKYLTGRDWAYEHVVGRTSWSLSDLTDVQKILERPYEDRIRRSTENVNLMKLSDDVPTDIRDDLLVCVCRGYDSGPDFVHQVKLPDRTITLPMTVPFSGFAYRDNPDNHVGIIFRLSPGYFVPIEQSKNGQGEVLKTTVRCDQLGKMEHTRIWDLTPPYDAKDLKLSRNVTPAEVRAIEWAVQRVFKPMAGHEVDVISRDRTQPEILPAQRVSEIWQKFKDAKRIVGVIYKIEDDEWFVSFSRFYHSDASAFDPSKVRHFFVSAAEKVVGRPPNDEYKWPGFSTFEKAGRNIQASLEAAIRQDYQQCFAEAKCVIA